MEKKLVILATTLVARLIWRLTKITSDPLQTAVFLAVQTTITVLVPVVRNRFGKKRPAKVT
jgi:hypothetical protein